MLNEVRKEEVLELAKVLISQQSYSGHEGGVAAELEKYMKANGFDDVTVDKYGNIIGKIENVSVDERVLDADGNLDFTKFRPISFEPAHADYRVLGEKVADAFQIGAQLK